MAAASVATAHPGSAPPGSTPPDRAHAEGAPARRRGAATVLLVALAAAPFALGIGSAAVEGDAALAAWQARPEGAGPGLAPGGTWAPLASLFLRLVARAHSGLLAIELLQLAAHVGAALLARRWAERAGAPALAAWFAAAWFAVHPVHAASVAHAAAVEQQLAALAVLGALERHAAWEERGGRGWPLGAALWLAAALCLHPFGLAAIAALAAVSLASRPRTVHSHWRAPALYAVVAGVWLAVQAGAGAAALAPESGLAALGGSARQVLALAERVGTGLLVVAWPGELVFARPFWPERGAGAAAPALLALAAALAVLVAALVRRRRGPVVAGFALALAGLAPSALGLDGAGQFVVADRSLALTALGVALAVASWLVARGRTWALVLAAAATVALGARAALRVADWDTPRALWSADVDAEPEHVHARWKLGLVELTAYRETGVTARLAAAFAHFDAAQDVAERARRDEDVPLVTSDDLARTNVGVAWCLAYEAEVDGYGDWGVAVEYADQLASARPLDAEVWLIAGVARAGAGDQDGALEALQRAVELRPDHAEAHRNLGLLHLSAGRVGEARRHLEHALALRPGDPELVFDVARASLADGRTERAVELAEALRRSHPADPRAYVLHATVRAQAHDLVGALELLERAVALDPEHGHAHSELAKVLLALGRRDDALVSLRRAVEFGPDLFEPHYNLAVLLLEDGLVEAAAPLLERAYRLCADPGLRAALRGRLALSLPPGERSDLALAVVDLQRGDAAAAESWLVRRLAAHPDDVEALLVGSRTAEQLGRTAEAGARLQRAVALEPTAFQPALDLARHLERHGSPAEAAAAYREALARLPTFGAEAQDALAREIEERIAALDG